ncbi:hypothetical protein [Flavobacterium sp. 7A]|uniref:hypothetical protein n=1 Tax=Flavobacterium sp. 7A TaxID=2940571 RepID=UPI0022272F74|nr:hypothetical protein [Flavobacterium sp. 7A]MCW2118737.1 type II secretory pathway pseudopilin PulG [Flavobacterium sp. 7A]
MKTKITLVVTMLIVAATTQAQISELNNAENGLAQISKQEKELKQEKENLKNEVKYLKRIEPSENSKSQFEEDFGTIKNVNWLGGPHFDTATFNQNNQEVTAYYDTDSNLVGTTIGKLITDLPVATQNKLKTKYPNYTTKSVIYFDDSKTNDTDIYIFDNLFGDKDCYLAFLTNGKQKIVVQIDDKGEIINDKITQ